MGERATYDPKDYATKGPLTDPDYVTEVSEFFLDGMRARMAFSRHKYGLLANAYPEKVVALGSLMQRLTKYAETGNAEWLIDVANFAMIEFMHPAHATPHFSATDSETTPVGRIERCSGEAVPFANRDIFA